MVLQSWINIENHLNEERVTTNISILNEKIRQYIRRNFSNDPKDFMRVPLMLITHPPPKIRFDDVIGIEEGRREIMDMLLMLNDFYALKKYKIKPPSGILLYGPPGCGKTLFAKAIAGEWGVPLIHVLPSDINSRWAGETESNIHHLFRFAKYISPCVLFIDEIDGIGGSRDGIQWRSERMDLSQLLTEMENIACHYPPVLVVGATNRLEDVDFALLRPGRFTKRIFVGLPNKNERVKLFKLYAKERPISNDVDFEYLSEITEGRSGAEIENLCNNAARNAWRRWRHRKKDGEITYRDFLDVINFRVKKQGVPIYR
ncbi:MAG: hypothetical protein DRN07_03970 [Thermoplasmata archaeon]|nr:MAG: hypothetical protein DRN07_03970 [Thermoplasmata archaeon]